MPLSFLVSLSLSSNADTPLSIEVVKPRHCIKKPATRAFGKDRDHMAVRYRRLCQISRFLPRVSAG